MSLSFSSFIIREVKAQAGSEYEYDNNYNSKYSPAYEYDKKKHNYYQQKDPPADLIVPIDFPTIQEAIDEANVDDVIKVLPGTYTEQITISKSLTIIGSGAKSTIIEAPLPLTDLEPSIIGPPYIVNIDNQAQVSIKGFTIKGIEGTDCDELFGITVLSDATLKLDSAVIKDCTNVGVIVGSLRIPTGAQTGDATIINTIITDYRANGIVVPGSGSTLTISHSKIIGDAPDAFGIIGISFHTGAKAKIVNNIISENKCKIPNTCGPNPITQVQAIGILADSAGKGSVISNNYVSNNDAGIVVFGTSGCCIIDHNKLTDNHFFGIVIADGEHTISNTKIFGGKVGVLAIAFSVNTVATLDHVKIIDAKIPVQALLSEGFTATVNVVSPISLHPD